MLFILLSFGRVQAQTSLYEGEVAVTTQNDAERGAVLSQALAQVLVKLSGDADAPRLPSVQARLPDARLLMQQFRYRQALENAGGQMQQRLYLIAGFDKAGVDALMADTGLPLWAPPRPSPLLWLAIDDGSGARLVSSAQAASLTALTAAAERRGLSLTFPLLDAEDRGQLSVNDVLSQRGDLLDTAAQRYGAKVQLVGQLVRGAAGWRSAWQLRERGAVLDSWQHSDIDPSQLLTAAVDRGTDALASRHATPVFVGEPQRYRIAVDGIASADDFARALGYLRGLGIVRKATPMAARGSRLLLTLELAASIDGLRHVVALGDVLEDVDKGIPRDSVPLTFPQVAPIDDNQDARFRLQQ
ncbi:MAG: DUF2066 domain-containing protein [Lysobacteraceae bacterium]